MNLFRKLLTGAALATAAFGAQAVNVVNGSL